MNRFSFEELMTRLAQAWERGDAVTAANCFIPKAVYMEPPDVQLFSGREEIEAYFSPLNRGTS